MSIKNFIIFLVRLRKPKAAATVSIEITSELFERCTRYNVTPERVINDFVANICGNEFLQAGSLVNESIFEYLGRTYGDLRKVNSAAIQQQRAGI